MPSPFCPDASRVVAGDFSSIRLHVARKSPLNRSLIALGAMLLLAAASVTRADNVVGAWAPPTNWPIIGIHAVLTPDGRVLTYGTTETGQQTGFTIYDIWDPATGIHATLPNGTGTDLFCSSQIIMPDTGNVLIAGGDNFVNGVTTNSGNNNSNVFTPSNNLLARGNNMNRARWYSSSTTLLNSEIYIQGGTSGGDRPEVRGTNGAFRLLSSANTSGYAETFPRNFLAPDGRVFGFDNSGKMYYVVPTGTGTITPVGQVGQLPGATSWTSSAAMFRPGRILQMGGASSAAWVIDINGASPVVTATQSMSSQRQWVSATVLPDGRVLATGGSSVDNALTNVNNSAEVWDPNGNNGTGKWTVGPSGVNARLYHSGALLLPDARVMIVGGGAPGPLVNTNIEMYTPSYLLDSNTPPGLMPRPSITTQLTAIDVGQSFSIGYSSPSSISRVTLVKTGSITHSVNMDQRFIELGFQANGAMLDVNGPLRATDTPPGYYLLFILSSQGVPSVGKIVRIGVAANPNPTPDATQVIGGTGGSPFTLACNANEVLAGIYGTSDGTHVNQAGLRCIQIDQNGRWIGTPVNRGITGAASGASYTKTCPTNYAISGYRGRSSSFVDQLDFECRALTSQGKLTGLGQFLGAVGGSGGVAQGPYNCGTNNPAYALTGRSGSWLDNFGMQCRQATLTTVNAPPTIVNPGNLTGTVGVAPSVTISASDPDGQALTFSAAGLPTGLGINSSTGQITGLPTVPGSFIVSITVTDPGNASANAGFTWTINPAAPFVLNPLTPATPTLAGGVATLTANSSNGVNARYSWFFDDGSAQTAYSSSPSITHTFATPGIYYVTVTAIDDFTAPQTQTVAQTIYLAATANRAANSSTIAYEQRSGSNSRVWVTNQDNDSVTAFDASMNTRLAEIAVGVAPRSIARAPDGRLWVTNKLSASISIINPDTLSVAQTLTLPFASQPYGIAFAPTGSFAFVVLEGLGRVLKLDASSGAVLASVAVGPNPRHLAVSGDGTTLLVSRFITPHLPGEETATVQTQNGAVQYGGEVVRINAASMSVLGTTVLQHSDQVDLENSGSGVPNYLGAPVISPDGSVAWVPSKQDNIKRGTLRNQLSLNFQNTVRAISSRIDLATFTEDYASRIDHDNASVASAVAFDKYGVYMFVALETSREVEVVDAHGRWKIFRFNVGRAPQALAVSPDGLRLYVNNFMDRTVSVFDLTRLVNFGETNVPLVATLPAVATEKLSAQVLKGKQFFYDAFDTRLARDRYLSCASCHNDGDQDGRVWDLTGFGEGLRNTVELRGRAGAQGQGFLHWSANFDEVQDFEGQIRNLSGGTGLMSNTDFNTGTRNQPLGDPKSGISADLDALAAYVASLNTFTSSPLRNSDGTLTADAQAGQQIFRDLNCAQCHSGTAFTESGAATLRDIGTIKPSSGQRLGGPLTGIDTPTLRDVWSTAPYLHDGSAATLGVAVRAHNGVTISDADLTKLVAYLQQIGKDEVAAPTQTNLAPTVTSPGAQNSVIGVALDLAILANDPNGDALTFTATGLPGGLGIGLNTGHVTGAPNAVGIYSVTVTASDGPLNGSASFNWTIVNPPDVTPPSAPATLTTSAISGTQINLSWGASTDNVAVTGYQIERCAGPGCSNFTALTTVTTTTYSNTGLTNATSYSYRVRATDAAANLSGYSNVSSVSTPDTQAPGAPSGLAATAATTTQINLSWTAATDNVGVTGYQIERCQNAGCNNFAPLATVTTASYSNTGLTAATSYSYRVRATDAAANLGAFSTPATASTPLATLPGLVAAYAFNEGTGTTTLDTSGNSNAGTISGATWITTGKNGGALLFDGVNDRVSVSASSSLALSAGMTLEAWVYPTASQSGWRTIMQREPDAYVLNASNDSGAGRPSGGGTFGGSFDYLTSTSALAVNAWSHVALTYDGATLRLYVNGTQVASKARTGAVQTSSNPLWIGGNSPYGEYFQGRIDDARVYNRALSVTEVQTDMNTPVGGTPAPDTTPPTTPASLSATVVSGTQLNLSWTASTDNLGVTGYQLERCQGGAGCTPFASLATVTTTTYNNTGLTAGTTYSYRVRATDLAGNLSAYSNVATATTTAPPPPDTTPPVVTITAPTNGTTYPTASTPINLTGTASDTVGVTQVTWSNDRGGSGTATGTTSWSVTGIVLQSGVNVLTVTARDAANNPGTDTLTVTYTPPAPDQTPPTTPSALTPTPSAGQINLSWTGSTDNVAVTGYQVERCQGPACSNFALLTTVTTTSYSNTGLAAATSYSYRVRAIDAALNTSAYSNTATATTPSATGPVAAFAFNEGTGTTSLDASGNSNTASLTGGAAWTTQGKYGGALQFDGLDDRVFVNASASLGVSSAMTLEAWVYPTSAQSGWRTIMQRETDAYVLNASNDTGAGRPSGGGTFGGNFDFVTATSALAVNTWTHVALTYNGSQLILYVNGVQVASKNRTGAVQASSNPLWIGGNSPYGEYFSGRIDDARVYNRALSAGEVQADMNTPVAP